MGRINKSKGNNRAAKLKRRFARDVDLIRNDWKDPELADRLRHDRDIDVEEPGLNQFYCLECDRKFVANKVLREHENTKAHKRRVKLLAREDNYTLQEAERGAGKTPADSGLQPKGMQTE
mmetsp:Transcript_2016/g.3589  ORF Transcript_2016/g.3589 Transcript_2016/m.3589 type:complete len:120 (+) Transcript_2016:120-479(+)